MKIRTPYNIKSGLTDIIGTQEVPDPDNYPEQLTLPENILASTRQLVSETNIDQRRRSRNFQYRKDAWQGGAAVKGALNETSCKDHLGTPNKYRELVARMWWPSLHVHTHPSVLPTAFLPVQHELLETPILPTLDDVHRLNYNLGATVGNLMASKGGLFLALRHDLEHVSYGSYSRLSPNVSEVNATLAGAAAQAIIEPTHKRHEVLMGAITQSLQDRFVCYFSGDPEAPYIERVA